MPLNRMRRRATRGGRRGGGRRLTARRGLEGIRFGVPVAPPDISPTPWNTLELALEAESTMPLNTLLTKSNVIDSVTASLGLTGAIQVRVQSFRFWATSLNVAFGSECVVTPFDVTSGVSYSQVLGTSGIAQAARGGWRWPKADQQTAFGSSSTGLLRLAVTSTAATTGNASVRVYLRLLWRPGSTVTTAATVDLRPTMVLGDLAADLSRLAVVESEDDRVHLIVALSSQQGDALDSEDQDLALSALPSLSNSDQEAIARQMM